MDTRPLDRSRLLRKPSGIGEEIRRELEKRGLRAPKLGKFRSVWLNENTKDPQSLIEKYGVAEKTEPQLHEPQDNDSQPTTAGLTDTMVDIALQDTPTDEAQRISVSEAEDEIEQELVAIQHDQASSEDETISAPDASDDNRRGLPETLVAIPEHDGVPTEEEISASAGTAGRESSDPEAQLGIQNDEQAPHEGVAAAGFNVNGDGETKPLIPVKAQDGVLTEKDQLQGQKPIEKDDRRTVVARQEADADPAENEIADESEAVHPESEQLPETEEFPQAQEHISDPTRETSLGSHARERFDEIDNPFTIIVNKKAPSKEPEEDLPQTAELDLEILALLDTYQNVQLPTSHGSEERSEVIESLLSTAAHELRTPLQTITGFLELLLSGKVTDPQQVEQFMRIAYREGNFLADRIADMEAASQIEAGTLKINPRSMVLSEVIKSSLHSFTVQSWDRAIRYDESNSAELPAIYADEDQLKHALINVVGIALKATPFGGEILVRVLHREEDLLVQVISGSGNLPEGMEDLPSRAMDENEIIPKGLGISVAGNILAMHGGSLQITGSSEDLLVFELQLPIKPKTKTKGTILVTDDNQQTAQMLEIALEKEGYSAIVASNGLEALEIVANDRVDLVILDIILPGMDGFEVCYRMRSAPETASIPVVIASAKNNAEDQSKALRVGADAYFQKPLVLSELFGSIEALLVHAGDKPIDELSAASSGEFLS
ncbi:MAG: response regulator [Chloroflexi bacterium]|nr:response regulator [Chloroflexota bacterium]